MDIKWHTPDSADGERTLKQHAFISAKRGHWYSEKYDGNKSLCSKSGVHDGDVYVSIDKVEEEPFNPKTACSRCFKIYLPLKTQQKKQKKNLMLRHQTVK